MSLEVANNYLAVHLHKLLAKENGNVFFSPFSISVAMGMLLCAAEGETASELISALGHKHAGVKKDNVASGFEKQLSILLEHHESYTLSFANSMLSQIGFKVKDGYKQIIANSFKSLMLEVDFQRDNQKVVNQINEWAKEKTNNMIPNFIKSLNSNTVLVLLNAVYFKGTWKEQFDKNVTNFEIFYNKGNSEKRVNMMHMKKSFPYYGDATFQALMLPYVGDEVAMMILLPRERKGLVSLEDTLSLSFIKDLKKKLWNVKVKITMPRFRLEYEQNLIPHFKKLGVKRIFGSGAEFKNLSDATDLSVSTIFHKAVVDVNEEGTEAAAVTMVSMMRCAPPPVPEFVADHPFLLMIYNTKTDLILFMGRVNEL